MSGGRRRKRRSSMAALGWLVPLLFFGVFAATIVRGQQQQQQQQQQEEEGEVVEEEEAAAAAEEEDRGSMLKRIDCEEDCSVTAEGSYCDIDSHTCVCRPDYPVSDANHCYKESKLGEYCRLDVQCQRLDKNSRCNKDLNVCQCQPRYEQMQSFSRGKREHWCVASANTGAGSNNSNSPGSYFDPALFGIMGGLVLMFIVLCVVLQLFAKAQFSENRTIFNTPNPRLMNVSLMKHNAKDRNKGNNWEDCGLPPRGGGGRKGSPATAAILAGTSAGTSATIAGISTRSASAAAASAATVMEEEEDIPVEIKDSVA